MLRLEKLEVQGFKSFGDRAELSFPAGITAIVGPNGCGKSNIGDAINWVLGEQSAKMLRGRNMADVIFGGSEARKPVGMAEVSLVFGGAEGLPRRTRASSSSRAACSAAAKASTGSTAGGPGSRTSRSCCDAPVSGRGPTPRSSRARSSRS